MEFGLVFLTLLYVNVQSSRQSSAEIEGIFIVRDNHKDPYLTVACPGTQKDDIDISFSKSASNLTFSIMASFRPDSQCQISDLYGCNNPVLPERCSQCGYKSEATQVFATISRNYDVKAFKCVYRQRKRELFFVFVDDDDLIYVYKNIIIGLSCLSCCLLLATLGHMFHLFRKSHIPQMKATFCCLRRKLDARTDYSITPSSISIESSQRIQSYTHEDQNFVDTCVSTIRHDPIDTSKAPANGSIRETQSTWL